MHIILTVDDDWGTRFNRRRQSRDRALTARVMALSARSVLWVHPSSLKLFPEPHLYLRSDDDFTALAGPGDFCFVEDVALLPAPEAVEDFIIFHWNRRYPSDQKFDPSILARGWTLAETSEFPGHSHEKITEERYCRVPSARPE